MSDYLWETADGKEIFVRNMETSHLKNAVKFIERHDFEDPNTEEMHVDWRAVYERMLIELRLRALEEINDPRH